MNAIRYSFILIVTSLNFICGAQTSGYKTVNKFPLPGDEKWDYLYSDDQEGKLYVSHGTMVQVVDEATGSIIGTINGMNGVHGIALVNGIGKGFISSGKDTAVTSFDIRSFKVLAKIKVTGTNPDGIIYDSFSGNIFVFNGKSNNSTVIDPIKEKVVSTINLSGKPEAAVSDGKGHVWVNLENESQICQINTSTLKAEKKWSLSPGEKPSGLALDTENQRLFSVCGNKMMIVSDAVEGKVITTVPIGENPDGAAFDPLLKCIYSSNGDGTVTVVSELNNNSYDVKETILTQRGAKTIAINRKNHHVYVSASETRQQAEEGKKPAIVPGSFRVLDIAMVR